MMDRVKRRFSLAALLLLPLLIVTSGCNKQSEEAAGSVGAPGSAKAAPPDPQAMQHFQSNPNIPPQAKAAIMAHMQGKGDVPQAAPAK